MHTCSAATSESSNIILALLAVWFDSLKMMGQGARKAESSFYCKTTACQGNTSYNGAELI